MINLATWLQTTPTSIDPESTLAQECQTHFSQGGEDIAIDFLLSSETVKGVFVDFGAYHPIRFSNTFTSFINGWRGVNVDGNPETIELFRRDRPQDVNIHALVSDREELVEYFQFKEGAWNTTNAAAARAFEASGRPEGKIIAIDKMQTVPAIQILDQHVGNKKFDLLTIDVEGMDVRIVQSIDFKRYRPTVLALEMGISEWSTPEFQAFLNKIEYKFFTQCMNTVIFKRSEG